MSFIIHSVNIVGQGALLIFRQARALLTSIVPCSVLLLLLPLFLLLLNIFSPLCTESIQRIGLLAAKGSSVNIMPERLAQDGILLTSHSLEWPWWAKDGMLARCV